MVVMVLEKVPVSARGELTRWLLEPYPGVFVGDVNAMVRERLWERCCKARGVGGVVQVWSTNSEQGFAIRIGGSTKRQLLDFEGLQLIRVPFQSL